MPQFIQQLLGNQQASTGLEHDEMLRRCRGWLDENQESTRWSLVWERLVDEKRLPTGMDRNDLLRCGYDWLTASHDRNGWRYVWLRLLGEPECPPDMDIDGLLRCGYEKLSGIEGHDDWTYIWSRLMDRPKLPSGIVRDDLLCRGHDWLLTYDTPGTWARIWQRLLDTKELPKEIDRVDLMRRGRDWLVRHDDRGEWTHVWRRLVDANGLPTEIDRNDQLRLGRDWLVRHGDNSEWTHVWRRVVGAKELPADIDRIDLLRRGRDWLVSHDDHPGWAYVWHCLMEKEQSDPDRRADLLKSVALWLNRPENRHRGEWNKLFEQFLDAGGIDDQLTQYAAEWIRNHIGQPQVPILTAKLLATSKRPTELDDLARSLFAWVSDNPDDGRTHAVVNKLRSRFSASTMEELRSALGCSSPLTVGWSALLEWLAAPQRSFAPAIISRLKKALKGGQQILGRISRRANGGFVIDLADPAVIAFLPDAEADLGQPADGDLHLGTSCEFRIIRFSTNNQNVIVSRRNVLVSRSLASVQAGDRVDGLVTSLKSYGAFVDLGGVSGLLLNQDMAWRTVTDPSEICPVGQRINVLVTNVDRERERISLGLKQLTPSPWETIKQKCRPGSKTHGIVRHIADFGVFVELDCGIQGLLHRSRIPGALALAERFKPGEQIQVCISKVDMQRRRIDLSLLEPQEHPS
jgi:predicted RNA-binding protein with RPS1 domain